MILGYLLLVLLPVAAIAYLVWTHKRRMADRDAVSTERLTELFGAAALPVIAPESGADAPQPVAAGAAPAVPSAAQTPPIDAPQAPALYAVRKRVLNAPQTLLYYLLRSGLPEYVILARITLASLLDAGPGLSGFARDEQMRRLGALTVDFVVIDRDMQPVVVIALAAGELGGAEKADRAAAHSRLAAAGVRVIELDPGALPRKDALRALVLNGALDGDAAAAATPSA